MVDWDGKLTYRPESSFLPMAKGDIVTVASPESSGTYRVSEVTHNPDGSETYSLEPAEDADDAH